MMYPPSSLDWSFSGLLLLPVFVAARTVVACRRQKLLIYVRIEQLGVGLEATQLLLYAPVCDVKH